MLIRGPGPHNCTPGPLVYGVSHSHLSNNLENRVARFFSAFSQAAMNRLEAVLKSAMGSKTGLCQRRNYFFRLPGPGKLSALGEGIRPDKGDFSSRVARIRPCFPSSRRRPRREPRRCTLLRPRPRPVGKFGVLVPPRTPEAIEGSAFRPRQKKGPSTNNDPPRNRKKSFAGMGPTMRVHNAARP